MYQFLPDDRPIELIKQQPLSTAEIRRMVIKEMYILRCRGMTDSEIARKYRYKNRVNVNRMINSLSQEEIDRLREMGLV